MINFSYDEKVKILKGLGYEIICEEVEPDYYARNDPSTEGDKYYADNVYFAGVCITDSSDFERLYDQDRVSRIFDIELKKRLLGLFS